MDGGAGTDELDIAMPDPFFGATTILDLESPSANTGSAAGGTFLNFEIFKAFALFAPASQFDFRGDENDNTVYGTTNADLMSGRGGNDVLNGGQGDDTLNGGAGNNVIDGGTGSDTAVYAHVRAEYDIFSTVVGGIEQTSVVHSRGSGADHDTLTNVEHVQFADMTTSAAGTAVALGANFEGSSSDDVLIRNGSTSETLYAVVSDGAATHSGRSCPRSACRVSPPSAPAISTVTATPKRCSSMPPMAASSTRRPAISSPAGARWRR